LDSLKKYDWASKTNIDFLFLTIFPSVLDEKRKAKKVRNLVYAMSKRAKSNENQGTVGYPKWVLGSSNFHDLGELTNCNIAGGGAQFDKSNLCCRLLQV
jgi:hypothetical protein